jgi:hypothetical protein
VLQVIDRLVELGLFTPDQAPNQVTVNEYEPGQVWLIVSQIRFLVCLFALFFLSLYKLFTS